MTQYHIRAFGDHKPELGQKVFVDPMAVVTGQVVLGDDVSVWPCTSVRGDLLAINIGARSNLQDNSVVHTTHDSRFYPGSACHIGEDVTVGHSATIHACTIGDRVLVGMGAIVLDQAVVESEVMIGAGSLVPIGKTLTSGHLYMGSPVKQIRELTRDELDYLKYSAHNYVELKNKHIASLELSVGG